MNHLKSAFALVASLCAAGAAHAGAGTLTTVVAPLSGNSAITYSTQATASRDALSSYVGYTVAIGNGGGNTINNIVFTATTTPVGSAEVADFASAEGATCQPAANPAGAAANARTVACSIGQLKAGQSYPPFVVFFNAPVQVGSTAGDAVKLAGTTFYAEGTGGLQSPPQNSTALWSAADVPLGTVNPSEIRSAVPKSGGTLFTGDGGVSDALSPFTTRVVIPTTSSFTTAEISVTPRPIAIEPNCTNFSPCYGTLVTIPGQFSPYLEFRLRVDATQIKKGTKIESVVLYYAADNLSFAPIGDCASPTTPALPAGTPCIAGRKFYKNSKVQGYTAELDGDFEWTILNLKNGGYKIN